LETHNFKIAVSELLAINLTDGGIAESSIDGKVIIVGVLILVRSF
jgi:hypothetical protein